MCPRFLFVDTNKSAHKGHHPHSHSWSTHGWNRTLTNQQETVCLEFATFDWPNFRLRAGIRRRPNLYFLNELENERAFGRLPNGFKKPFLSGEPLAFERTTEDLVFWKSENAAALGRISSPRIRRILNFPQPDLWGVGEISLVRVRRLPGLTLRR